MTGRNFTLPKYWLVFNFILAIFKVLGMMPVKLKLPHNCKKAMEVHICKKDLVFSVVIFAATLLHAIWGPTVLINYEKLHNISMYRFEEKNGNFTALYSNSYSKFSILLKSIYPLMGSATSLTSRFFSVSIFLRFMPDFLQTIYKVDILLRFRLTHFLTMSVWAGVGFILHIPIIYLHFSYVYNITTFLGKIWEVFSMYNVLAGFAMDLLFATLCVTIRNRFMHINSSLKLLAAQEFYQNEKSIFYQWKKSVKLRKPKVFTSTRRDRTEVFKIFSNLDNFSVGKIRKISEFKDDWKGDTIAEWRKINMLKSLRRAHIILYDLMQRINKNYQIHLLASVCTFITKALLNLYYIMYELVNSVEIDRRKQHSKDPSLSVIWCSYYFCRFFLVVTFAHCTAASSKEASNIISKIEYKEFEIFSQQQVKMFAEHLSRSDFEFSACGLFNLNTSLISTSFSTVITYLVIMMQFH